MKKRIVSFVLIAVILASAFALASCGNVPRAESLKYTLGGDGENYSVSGVGNITATEIVIPPEYNGKPVTEIADRAFEKNGKITSVAISYSVTKIGSRAFDGCDSLKKVVISRMIESIGEYAFGYRRDGKSGAEVKVDGLTIYGFAGTASEEYAKENGIDFCEHSDHVPTRDGVFWYEIDMGEIGIWQITTEPFEGVKFTGETQEGRAIEYDFDDETEQRFIKLMSECDELIDKGEDYDAFKKAYDEIDAIVLKIDDARIFEEIRFNMYGSKEARAKMDHFNEHKIRHSQWKNDASVKLAEGPFRNDFYSDKTDEEIAEIVSQKKTDEYYELKMRKNAIESEFALLDEDEEFFDKVHELYVEFVNVTNKMAKLDGYDNYLDFEYKNAYGRTYSAKDTDAFFEYVKKYVYPKYIEGHQKFLDDYYSLSGANQDRVYYFMIGDVFTENFGEFYAYEKAVGGKFSEAFDSLWREDGPFYISYDNVGNYAYLSVPLSSGERLVFFGKNYHRIMTVIHEFGHYYAFFGGESGIDIDLCETQSQSNEFLFLRYLESTGFYPDKIIGILEEWETDTLLATLIRCAMINEIEKMAYFDDDFTLDDISAAVEAVIADVGDTDDLVGLRNYWEYIAIKQPGYYISYSTSLIGAFNIFKIAEDDFDAAVSAYNKLVDYSENGVPNHLVDVYAYAGLCDPFTEDAFVYIFG